MKVTTRGEVNRRNARNKRRLHVPILIIIIIIIIISILCGFEIKTNLN
jgi:t-SNARE complex subunit (syntaxin)